LYSLDAVAYESVMLGVFGIHKGPENSQCLAGRFPKTTDLSIGYSRDGFNWHRPDRTPFLAASRQENRWDRGYLHSVGGVCLVVGDELWFYYSGFSGISPGHGTGMYAGGSTGLATLRRDGFASMDADSEAGTLTTRPVVFHGAYLFVNLLARQGEMRVEVLDESGRPIAPFTRDQCEPISGDTTRERVDWRGAQDMRVLAGRPVRFRFHLTGGSLYAFWISGSPRGESGGYLAAGGPGFTGPRDMPR